MLTCISSDHQIPFQSDSAIREWIKHISDRRPDKIILDGDVMDCNQLSVFESAPDPTRTFKEEVRLTKMFLKTVRQHCPHAEIIYIFSNHEDRYRQKLIYQVPELVEFKEFTLESLLELDSLGIRCVAQEQKAASWIGSYVEDQGFYVGHYRKVCGKAGYTASALMDELGVSVVQGHVHRLAHVFKRIMGKTLQGIESGCMCDLNPDYVLHTNWENGYVDIEDGVASIHHIL